MWISVSVIFVVSFSATVFWKLRQFKHHIRLSKSKLSNQCSKTVLRSSFLYYSLFIRPRNDGFALRKILHHLKNAKVSIKMASFVVSGTKIAAALRAASERGVQVDVIFDGQNERFENTEFDPTRLTRSGIRVRLFKYSDPQLQARSMRNDRPGFSSSALFHEKFLIIDDQLTIFGSCNFSEYSLANHYENMVTTDDPDILMALIHEFSSLYNSIPAFTTPVPKQPTT